MITFHGNKDSEELGFSGGDVRHSFSAGVADWYNSHFTYRFK